MKKILYIVLGLVAVIIVLAAVLPIIFKDDIRALVDKQLEENVNAHVYFDPDEFSVSLFRSFPNLTVGLGHFGIVGNAPFKGDTLTRIDEFSISINLLSLMGNEIVIENVRLDRPYIHVRVLEDGTANYDIAVATDSAVVEEGPTESSDLLVKVNGWEIENGRLIYDDKSLVTFVDAEGLNHTGSGDFTLAVFDLFTETSIDSIVIEYDGLRYFDKNRVNADITLNMDISDIYTFTFKENTLKINDFAIGADGWFKMPEDRYEMDITFHSKEDDFKSLLSLVPGVFLEGFEQLKTEGKIGFDGFVKGFYDEETMPGFKVNLEVDKGMFQYPDLPTAINNIMVDMEVDNTSGILDDMVIDIRNFHMDMGKNPINGKVKIAGLTNYDVAADVNATLNLSDLTTMFPMEGLALAGTFSTNIKANGIYNEEKGTIPTIDASMLLADGKVQSTDYPVPMENIQVKTFIKNESGVLNDTRVDIDNISLLVDNEPFTAEGHIYNFDDITYTFNMKGALDFSLIDKIYPLDGMSLAGKMNADITTSGKMSDIEAERYDKLPTSGEMSINDLAFSSTDLPQGLKISKATATFNPKSIVLKNYEGFLGESDMKLNGSISNYLGYALRENEVLKGSFTMNGNYFNANEWMVEDSTATPTSEEEEAYGVIPIPKTLDFAFNAAIGKVRYENFDMQNLQGNILMKDGILNMKGVRFNLLGGAFVTNGSYNTQDPEKPKFDFELDISQLSIAKSYESFNTVQTFAPLAQNMNGNFSSKLKVSGDLGQDLMPVYQTLTGGGGITINDAKIEGAKVLDLMSQKLGVKALENPSLKDVKLQADFEDGKMKIKPFDFELGGIKTNVQGATAFTGDLDYDVKMDVPANILGNSLSSSYASFTGQETIPLSFNILGVYDAPKVGFDDSQAKQMAKEKAKGEIKEQAGKLLNGILNKNSANDSTASKTAQDSTKVNLKDEAKDKIEDLKNKLPFGKKKNNN